MNNLKEQLGNKGYKPRNRSKKPVKEISAEDRNKINRFIDCVAENTAELKDLKFTHALGSKGIISDFAQTYNRIARAKVIIEAVDAKDDTTKRVLYQLIDELAANGKTSRGLLFMDKEIFIEFRTIINYIKNGHARFLERKKAIEK